MTYQRLHADPDSFPKSKWEQRQDYLLRKFWAAVWVGIALFTAKLVDLWHVVMEGHVPGKPQYTLHWFVAGRRLAPDRSRAHRNNRPRRRGQGILQTWTVLLWALDHRRRVLDTLGEVHVEGGGGVGKLLSQGHSLCDHLWAGWHHCVRAAATITLGWWLGRRVHPTWLRASARRFTIAFWPVWGFLTLPTNFIFFMGMLHLAHFIPI